MSADIEQKCDDPSEAWQPFADGASQSTVAQEFGVSRSAIMQIVSGRSWKHSAPEGVFP